MTLTDQTLRRSVLAVEDGRALLDVRLPWYRSMPLGAMRIGGLRLDGAEIAPADVSWIVAGRELDAARAAATADPWYLQDPVTLVLPLIPEGETVRVELAFDVQVAYLAPGVAPVLRVEAEGLVPVRRSARSG